MFLLHDHFQILHLVYFGSGQVLHFYHRKLVAALRQVRPFLRLGLHVEQTPVYREELLLVRVNLQIYAVQTVLNKSAEPRIPILQEQLFIFHRENCLYFLHRKVVDFDVVVLGFADLEFLLVLHIQHLQHLEGSFLLVVDFKRHEGRGWVLHLDKIQHSLLVLYVVYSIKKYFCSQFCTVRSRTSSTCR